MRQAFGSPGILKLEPVVVSVCCKHCGDVDDFRHLQISSHVEGRATDWELGFSCSFLRAFPI